ncbi:uncharacterized protein LOC144579810 [Callithrix jacchus]
MDSPNTALERITSFSRASVKKDCERKLTKGFVPRRPFPACAAPHSDRGLQCAERSAASSSQSSGSAMAAGDHPREIKPLLQQQNGSKSNQSLAFSRESRLCLFGSPSRVIPGSATFTLQGALWNPTGCAACSRTRGARPGRVVGERDVPGKEDPLFGTTVPDQRERALVLDGCKRGRKARRLGLPSSVRGGGRRRT